MSEPKTHLTRHDHCRVQYFNDSPSGGRMACNREEALYAEVTVGPHYPRFEFAMPEGEHELERLVYAFDLVFERGKVAKAREIRKALGVEG